MDVIKFFKETLDKTMQTGYQPTGMTADEARKCVEDVLNRAMHTVATLEKLHQQQARQPNQPSHLSSSKISPIRDEKKSILKACKEATFWLSTVKSKITPTYFHLPVPDNRLTTASSVSILTPGTPSPRPRFTPPKLKY